MCRVLVWWKDKPRSLKENWKHDATSPRRGDLVVAMKDGHVWGREEGLPNFVSLDMDGVPKEEMRQFTVAEESVLVRPDGKPYQMYKQAYTIDVDKLPKAVLDGLRRDGHAAVSRMDLRIVHKRTGLVR